MAIEEYTPHELSIIHTTKVDFVNRTNIGNPLHIVQLDWGIPILEVKLLKNGLDYEIPLAGVSEANAFANIRLLKKDGTFVHNPALGCDSTHTKLYFEITPQMTAIPGAVEPVVEIVLTYLGVVCSGSFKMVVDRNPIGMPAIESQTEWKVIEDVVEKAETAQSILDEQEETTKLTLLNALLLSILYSNKIFNSDHYKIITFDDSSLYTVQSGESGIYGNNRVIG